MRGRIVFMLIAVVALISLVLWRRKVVRERQEEWRRLQEQSFPGYKIVADVFAWANTRSSYEGSRVALAKRTEDESREVANLFSAVVNNVVGVFRQVNTVGEPIYKHVSGGKWGMRQINAVGQAIFKPSWFGSTCQFLGMVSSYGALAVDAVTVYGAAMKDMEQGTISNTVCSANKAAGGYYGAAYGAAVGASLLSFVPLVGPLVGGVIGGFYGMTMGSALGSYIAETIIATNC